MTSPNDESGAVEVPLRSREDQLSWFNRAYSLLLKCDRIDEIKNLRDKALALQSYLKQSRQSLEMQNMAAEIRIRSERRGGQILSDMDLNPGGQAEHKSYLSRQSTGKIPKLSDLGISRNQSSRWQVIASIPEEEFEQRVKSLKDGGRELTSSEILSYAGYLKRESERDARRQEASEAAAKVPPDDRVRVIHGDFREVLNEEVVPTDSVNIVLTDPMYGKDHLHLWKDLAKFASRVLKPGSLLVAYSGQTYLMEVLKSLEQYLSYVWIAGIRYSYPNNIFPLRIKNSLKLLLLFSKGPYDPGPTQYWLRDLIDGDHYTTTKQESELQQGSGEAAYLIETLTHPGDLVVDPFTGTGTVPLAAKRNGRRFMGAEISKVRYDLAVSRIAQEETAPLFS